MLSEREREEIAEAVRRGPRKRAVAIQALVTVQGHRGWVSDEGVRDVAEALGMTPDEVDGIATSYEGIYRRPVGRHVIEICDSVSCWICGCDGIGDFICKTLGIGFGETTRGGGITLLPAGCLGACDRAPAMMVDGDLHGNLTPEKVKELLARCEEGMDGEAAHR